MAQIGILGQNGTSQVAARCNADGELIVAPSGGVFPVSAIMRATDAGAVVRDVLCTTSGILLGAPTLWDGAALVPQAGDALGRAVVSPFVTKLWDGAAMRDALCDSSGRIAIMPAALQLWDGAALRNALCDSSGRLTITPAALQLLDGATLRSAVCDSSGRLTITPAALQLLDGATLRSAMCDSSGRLTITPAATQLYDGSNLRSALSDTSGRQVTVGAQNASNQVWKVSSQTSQQTSVSIWTPASGKRIVVTKLSVSTYGSTAARMILYFGSGNYSSGTDQPLEILNFTPTSSASPGALPAYNQPVYGGVDLPLKITTSAALSYDLVVYGREE